MVRTLTRLWSRGRPRPELSPQGRLGAFPGVSQDLTVFMFLKKIRDERGNRRRGNLLLTLRGIFRQDSLVFAVVTY